MAGPTIVWIFLIVAIALIVVIVLIGLLAVVVGIYEAGRESRWKSPEAREEFHQFFGPDVEINPENVESQDAVRHRLEELALLPEKGQFWEARDLADLFGFKPEWGWQKHARTTA
jgi:ABC-type phosphate transport system auxiliary subunit